MRRLDCVVITHCVWPGPKIHAFPRCEGLKRDLGYSRITPTHGTGANLLPTVGGGLHTHTHSHARTQTHRETPHSCTHTHTTHTETPHTPMHPHTLMHTLPTLTHAGTHTHRHTHTANTHTCTHTHTANRHTHIHTTHAHSHRHTDTHTYTHCQHTSLSGVLTCCMTWGTLHLNSAEPTHSTRESCPEQY